jgi:PBP1b-binding outer membrane lipoprotein LpoB
MTTFLRIAASTLLLLGCAACSKPEPPKKEQPPEPQAQAAQHTELRDAIQKPIERANAVEGQVLDAAKQQQDAIDAQAGG